MTYLLYEIKTDKIVSVEMLQVLDKLYFLEYRPITVEDIDNDKKNKELMQLLEKHSPDEIIESIKKNLSVIEDKIPLYDVYTENIYLINSGNVYNRVIHQFYRFPEQKLLDELNKTKLELESQKITDKLVLRKLNKITLMIKFMGYFDIDTLFNTYVKVFYKYSELVGKELTICKNPSFLQYFFHIKPYLTRSEVINFALNLNVKTSTNIEYDELLKLCNILRSYQITSHTLLEHQKYIMESGKLGLVQYYTLQGSHYMNQYLRNLTKYVGTNKQLEDLIKPMWECVLQAPPFDKKYVLYRFIRNDDHLQNLKIGDTFIENGFMSTTRDPFYGSGLYQFGMILIKINIPEGVKGLALCLETISHFPDEQEIIFPPKTTFKLKKRDNDCLYYHTDPYFSSKVKTRYEFDWVSNDKLSFTRTKNKDDLKMVNFLTAKKGNFEMLHDNILFFERNYLNDQSQCKCKIGEKEFVVIAEHFNSVGAYKHFYALNIDNGFALYVVYRGYVLFFIEIGDPEGVPQIHINYYVKYSSVDPDQIVGDHNMIHFFSTIAQYFNINLAAIYAGYLNCDAVVSIDDAQTGGANIYVPKFMPNYKIQRGYDGSSSHKNSIMKTEISMMGGSYCKDLFDYLAYGTKRYSGDNLLNVELLPKFSYFDLDLLKVTSPSIILKREDRDELYQLYDKVFKNNKHVTDSIAEFYKWLKDTKGYLLDTFVFKIDRLLGKDNPFKNDVYILDPMTYLYNRKYVTTYVSGDTDIEIKRNVLKINRFLTDRRQ